MPYRILKREEVSLRHSLVHALTDIIYFGLYWNAPKKPRITNIIWKKLRRMGIHKKPKKSKTCFSMTVSCAQQKWSVVLLVPPALGLTICRTHIVRKKYLLVQIPMSFALVCFIYSYNPTALLGHRLSPRPSQHTPSALACTTGHGTTDKAGPFYRKSNQRLAFVIKRPDGLTLGHFTLEVRCPDCL